MSRRSDQHEQLPSETDPRFSSGLWRGHYVQWGRKSRQEMTLYFAAGVITGHGGDPAGGFVVSGEYDTSTGRGTLVKRYPGAHSVHYDATFEFKNGMWGLWEIRGFDRGGFQLWPVGGPGSGAHREEEADIPADEPALSR